MEGMQLYFSLFEGVSGGKFVEFYLRTSTVAQLLSIFIQFNQNAWCTTYILFCVRIYHSCSCTRYVHLLFPTLQHIFIAKISSEIMFLLYWEKGSACHDMYTFHRSKFCNFCRHSKHAWTRKNLNQTTLPNS